MVALLSRKPAISLKRGKIGPRLYYWCLFLSFLPLFFLWEFCRQVAYLYALSISAKINDLGWPWTAITHCFKTHAFRGPPRHTEILMKIVPYYQRRRCSQMTLDSGIVIGLCGYSRGFPGEGASNDSGVIENVNFQGFRTLRLRHLRKWSQHYYIVLFSPLSLFHWPQNAWLWVAILRSIFTITNSVSAIRLHIYRIELFVEFFCCMTLPAEMCGSGF